MSWVSFLDNNVTRQASDARPRAERVMKALEELGVPEPGVTSRENAIVISWEMLDMADDSADCIIWVSPDSIDVTASGYGFWIEATTNAPEMVAKIVDVFFGGSTK
jgi:hypothetical protein